MKKPVAWMARNHVAANLLMFLIIGCGIISVNTIRMQVTPDIDSQFVNVSVPFPGASPGEVESGVIVRVEEALRDIEGISRMSSTSRQGSGRVSLKLDNDVDIQVVIDEVNMAMGRISSMPGQTERYSVSRTFRQMDAISVQISGKGITERSLKALAVTVQPAVVPAVEPDILVVEDVAALGEDLARCGQAEAEVPHVGAELERILSISRWRQCSRGRLCSRGSAAP